MYMSTASATSLYVKIHNEKIDGVLSLTPQDKQREHMNHFCHDCAVIVLVLW